MAKTKAPVQAATPAVTPTAEAAGGKPGVVAKIKDFGKNVKTRAAEVGTKAASHVSRNRAAYIAGGAGVAGLAAGAAGLSALRRKKQAENEG